MKKISKLFKENDLVKFVSIAIFVTLILTWIIPGGSYAGKVFTKGDVTRIGLNELSISGVYAVSFFLQQISFVLAIGAFYGVITLTSGYKELVSKCAKFVKGKEIPVALIVSALIAVFVSITSQVFISFIAIPFIITVLLRAGFDKKAAFAITFGSVFVGIIGATYGTDGLYFFSYYMQGDLKTNIGMRFAVLAAAYVLFNIFNALYLKKLITGKKSVDESKEDKFAVEESSKKKTKIWPIIVLLALVAVFAILGYVRWQEQFKIEAFAKFHEQLTTKMTIGDHAIFAYILGGVNALGTWELYSIFPLLFVITIIAAIVYKVSIDEYIDGIIDGITKMIKPVLLMVLAYAVFVIVYWSPIVPTISHWILKSKFNSFSTALAAGISAIFTPDFGYTGYTIGQYLISAYANNISDVFVIYPAMNGFIQMIAPTSVILLAGLSYANVSYKDWIKYIWKFIIALLITLLIIFVI